MRLGNDTSRDHVSVVGAPCRSNRCWEVATTRKSSGRRQGLRVKASVGPWEKAQDFWFCTSIFENIHSLLFYSRITMRPYQVIISYAWHMFSYCSLFNFSFTKTRLYIPNSTLPLSFIGKLQGSELHLYTSSFIYSKQMCQLIVSEHPINKHWLQKSCLCNLEISM